MFNPDHPTNMDRLQQIITEKITRKLEGEKNLDFIKNLFLELPELELFLVGGMTRDLLIGEVVSKDYDFIARGVEPARLIETLKKFGQVDFVGRNFGVLKFVPHGSKLKEPIDIAFPRIEQAQGTGGYRDVQTVSNHLLPIEEDLKRRDLTINAIAFDVRNKKIIDPFQGQQDLQNKIIRAVGNPHERFQEDYSRMLRAIRFACRFDFGIEPQTMEALVELMPHLNDEREITIIESLSRKLGQTTDPAEQQILKEKISIQKQADSTIDKTERVVPMETITKEILKTLKENPARALELYNQTGLLNILLPEVADLRQDSAQWQNLITVLAKTQEPEFVIFTDRQKFSSIFILGIILHHVIDHNPRFLQGEKPGHGSPLAQLLNYLKLTIIERQRIQALLLGFRQIDTPAFEKLTVQEQVICSDMGNEIIALRFLETRTARQDDSLFEKRLARLSALMDEEGRLPPPLINGHDIITTLKLKKGGPIISTILTAVREHQLRGQIKTKNQALNFIKSYGQ